MQLSLGFIFFLSHLHSTTVQNSIICDRVVIESLCKVNDCNIGSGYKIATGSKIKSESFSSASH